MCMEALLANFDKIPKTNTKIPLPITLKTSTPFNKRKEKETTLDLTSYMYHKNIETKKRNPNRKLYKNKPRVLGPW